MANPGASPRAARAAATAGSPTPARAAISRSPRAMRLAVASSVAAASPGSAIAAPVSRIRPSSATERPSSATNQGLIPVASTSAGSPTPRRRSASTRQSRLSEGARNRRRTIGAALRWARRVLSQASPSSSIQRMTASASSGSPPRAAAR